MLRVSRGQGWGVEVEAEKPEEGAPEEAAQSRVTVGRGRSPVERCGRGRAEPGGQRVCASPVRVPDWPTWCIGAQPPAGTCAPAGPEGLTQFPSLAYLCQLPLPTILPHFWKDPGCAVGIPTSLPSLPFSLHGVGFMALLV